MNRRSSASFVVAGFIGAALFAVPTPPRAEAAITCSAHETAYLACGRVFPDPEAALTTDPWSEGLVPASDFIQFGDVSLPGGSEFIDGLRFLEQRYDRFVDVWRLDELLGNEDALSSGLWLNGERRRHPLIMVRVTDEAVPASQKKRFVFGLSLHGIERAGVEGGTRAIEDLATYAHCESLGSLAAARADAACANQRHVRLGAFQEGHGGFPARLLPWDAESLTMGETLQRAELYFTYNNPDGWRRGDKVGGVGHYQRYTGNGVDPNRDWPTLGYTFRPYTPGSEPETKYFAEALRARGGNWASGIDLHGMGEESVLTFTMLPAGQHDYRKNARIRAIAERTQRDATERLEWSPLIGDVAGVAGIELPGGGAINIMQGQSWGTVWDTLNYTVTGAYGDWINSPIGLNAIGADNEMAYSHVTNCGVGSCFLPELEQLHVAGNKGLIYTDIDTTLRTEEQAYRFPFEGRGAYIRYDNVKQQRGAARAATAFADLPPQESVRDSITCPFRCEHEFEILGPSDGVLNRGVTVNIGFAAPQSTNDSSGVWVRLERWAPDPHGEDEGEWVIANQHFHQEAGPYLSNGVTLTANEPQPGRWRFTFYPQNAGPYGYEILFDDEPANLEPPQMPYRATQFDFFDELNRYLPGEQRFDALDTAEVLADPLVLKNYDVLVLSDDPLDGWDEADPKASIRSKAEKRRYYDTLRAFVREGRTLVLLDGATSGLAELLGEKRLTPTRQVAYAGYMGFNDGDGTTYDDPLAADVNVPGAAEGSGNRHQTYEPVPIGYSIDQNSSPIWVIPRDAYEETGGRIAATVGGDVVLGEVPFGEGSIRFAGALLPPPTDGFDHPFGLASYALTYTGWQLFENLVKVEAAAGPITEPKVLGGKHLPATGFTTPLLWLALLLVPAVLIARKVRDIPWI